MKHSRYAINNNNGLSLFLTLIDFFSSLFLKKNESSIDEIHPKKILISNIAHLGDVILTTGVLTVLKKEFPNSKICFLCGSWANEILKDHPLIDKIYNFDHYKLNRSNISFFSKIIRHLKTKKETVNAIRHENFSIAIDFRLHFPNSIYLLYKGEIPIRIGYTSGGFSNYFTHKLDYESKNEHITKYFINLLNVFIKDKIRQKQLLPNINLYPPNSLDILNLDLPKNYYIIHIGAGNSLKMIDINKWIELKNRLLMNKNTIVFTGFGTIENELISEIISTSRSCYNLCDKLNFKELIEVVKNSRKVFSVDTSIIHIAAALNVPLVIFYSKLNNHHNWVLKKDNIKVIEFESENSDTIDIKKLKI
jgi:ADP-heptose:LPS heptosyltransferase